MLFRSALAAVIVLEHSVPGGWPAIRELAGHAGKFRFLDWSLSPWSTYTFWSGVIGGSFLIVGTHGVDQLIVQRLLAARDKKQAQLAIVTSGITVFFQFTLFLLIGAMLFVFYTMPPHARTFARTDTVFPTFIATQLPHDWPRRPHAVGSVPARHCVEKQQPAQLVPSHCGPTVSPQACSVELQSW